ncbi:MAG TPA: hypothetical protein VFK32_06685 [Tepidiformaceae bacterium]|nr:hypothetical protein [Tepidiformaceae bacterium]
MRRRARSFLAILFLLTAALVPRAAVFAQDASACEIDRSTTLLRLADVDLVVIAQVEDADADSATVQPEVYLKGAATGESVSLERPTGTPAGCTLATIVAGDRVLLLLKAEGGVYLWPAVEEVYTLRDGSALRGEPLLDSTPENQLIDDIRSVTGQEAVAAGDGDDGASIEWLGTVVPVTVALVLVLGIGLVMMREWHRIDPT